MALALAAVRSRCCSRALRSLDPVLLLGSEQLPALVRLLLTRATHTDRVVCCAIFLALAVDVIVGRRWGSRSRSRGRAMAEPSATTASRALDAGSAQIEPLESELLDEELVAARELPVPVGRRQAPRADPCALARAEARSQSATPTTTEHVALHHVALHLVVYACVLQLLPRMLPDMDAHWLHLSSCCACAVLELVLGRGQVKPRTSARRSVTAAALDAAEIESLEELPDFDIDVWDAPPLDGAAAAHSSRALPSTQMTDAEATPCETAPRCSAMHESELEAMIDARCSLLIELERQRREQREQRELERKRHSPRRALAAPCNGARV